MWDTPPLDPIDIDSLVLGVSEAVTNALIHGRRPVRFRLWLAPDRIVATVTDRGDGPADPFAGAPIDTDIASQAGSALTALTPEDLHTTARPAELLQRARPDRDHGLGILVWADAVISATSRDTHVEIETTLAGLWRSGTSERSTRAADHDAPRTGRRPVEIRRGALRRR